ncbi:hypothetical protein BFL35_12755 [Clavibacter michiganensis]|nr:hypothetical protein BFL35_12755 [Clavibacter michiganensis]
MPTTTAVPSQSSSTATTDPITRPTDRSPVSAMATPSTMGGTHEITGRIAYTVSLRRPPSPGDTSPPSHSRSSTTGTAAAATATPAGARARSAATRPASSTIAAVPPTNATR